MKAAHIRPVLSVDHTQLLALWERSVRATHHFLTDADVTALRPLVALEFAEPRLQWWVRCADTQRIVAFLGWSPNTIEGLFVDPACRQMGHGKALVTFAQGLAPGAALTVEVNEQNEPATRFYRTLGFVVETRSETDGHGRPFPILVMRRPAAQPARALVGVQDARQATP